MKVSVWVLAVSLALLTVAGPGRSLAQEPPKIINVIVIDVAGDLPKFLELFKQVRGINERLATKGVSRVWQSTLAGPNTGTVAVAVEHPSLVSMAQDGAKVAADAEWQKVVDAFQAAGMRVVSNSVSVEITP
jgi:hypothetical protein